MGLHDRAYARSRPAPASAGRPGAWSVTTWIAVLCAAVFVIDGFLPRAIEPVRSEPMRGVDPAELAETDPREFRVVLPTDGRMVADGIAVLGDRPVARVELRSMHPLMMLGYFSTAKAIYASDPVLGVSGFQVWRFVSFQFLHANLNHILFNMITLVIFGGMVERYLGAKRYLAFYLLCGVAGAVMYLALNGLALAGQSMFGPDFRAPGLLFNDPSTPLVGASAGVFGVLMAAAFLAPNAQVLFFFVIPMRLQTLAYGLLGFALLAVVFGWVNAGGEAAHIGGALAGWYLIRNPAHLHGFFDFIGQYDPTSRVASARKAVRRGTARGVDDVEVNRILDKISAQGLHSLTEAEKRVLREASRR